jgi:hypothetical protein
MKNRAMLDTLLVEWRYPSMTDDQFRACCDIMEREVGDMWDELVENGKGLGLSDEAMMETFRRTFIALK